MGSDEQIFEDDLMDLISKAMENGVSADSIVSILETQAMTIKEEHGDD